MKFLGRYALNLGFLKLIQANYFKQNMLLLICEKGIYWLSNCIKVRIILYFYPNKIFS